MQKPVDLDLLRAISQEWRLDDTGPPFATHSSILMPAFRNGHPVMLKLTTEPDEIRGGGLLEWWQGRGAVRVLERSNGALLMERPLGTCSLVELSRSGDDEAAIDILCAVARELHRPGAAPLPPLEPIETLFQPLIASEWDEPIVQSGRNIAIELLSSQVEPVPLHGDIQHHNVLDAGEGRWLAIDPKGQFGERTYDFANLFRNPDVSIANDPSVFARRVDLLARCSALDARRLRDWIAAFCALCLVWDYYPEGSPDSDRTLAALAIGNEATNRS